MKQNTKFKIFIAAASGTIVFTSLASYSFYKAFSNDPELAPKIEKTLSDRYALKNFHISVNGISSGGGSFSQLTSSSNFSAKTKTIAVRTLTGDIEITPTDGEEIIVKAKGDLSSKSLLKTKFDQDELSIEQPDDNSVKNLKVNIYIPKTFANDLKIETVSGNVSLEKTLFSKMEIQTVSGEVNLSDLTTKSLEVETVSGDVIVHFNKPTVVNAELETVSGKITNGLKTSNEQALPLKITTVSGNMTLSE